MVESCPKSRFVCVPGFLVSPASVVVAECAPLLWSLLESSEDSSAEGAPKRNKASAPCKTGEVGACKDLDGNVFTIGSGNKGKDGDLLRTSKEKLALYIGTNYGDDACQEWMSEKQLVLLEPTYPPAVLARQAVRATAISARVTKMITNLEKQLEVIEKELVSDPNDLNLLKNQMEVDNKLELAKFELTDVVEVKTTVIKVFSGTSACCFYSFIIMIILILLSVFKFWICGFSKRSFTDWTR